MMTVVVWVLGERMTVVSETPPHWMPSPAAAAVRTVDVMTTLLSPFSLPGVETRAAAEDATRPRP